MAKTTSKKSASKKKTSTSKKTTTARSATSKKSSTSKKTTAAQKSATKKKATQSKSIPSRKTGTVSKTKATAKKATKKKETMSKAASKPTSSSAATLEGILGFTPYKVKKGEEYMNSTQREHFKHILEVWKKQLMQEVDRTLLHMQDEASNLPDPIDRATLEEEFSLELRTRDRERKLIKKIDSTLEHIKHDDYGYCETCGIEIGIRRLEARPTANQCIDCKTLDEIKEKQFNS